MFRKLFRKNTESVGDANSQKDYLEYCKSIEQTLSQLESSLHTSDSPEEIAMMAMQTACEFYGADWCGFLEVDLDLGLWTPYWWHNVNPEDKTMDLLEEFGSAANLYRWVRAMKHNQTMIVPDVQAISEKYPDEFRLYGRLHVNSLLAVPVKPRPVGFLVVRNPSRFVGRSSMLQMLAFVVLSAINEHRLFESARLTASHDIIQSETDILNTLLYSISDIERMADHAMAVAKAALEMEEKKIEFSYQAKGEPAVLEQAVLDIPNTLQNHNC